MHGKFYTILLFTTLTTTVIGQEREPVFLESPEEEAERVERQPSNVFGMHLFQGDFRDESFTGFNPNYQLAVGDKLRLQVWGAVQIDAVLGVDARGNIFIPEVGPVSVSGVRNDKLNDVISNAIKKVYRDSVEVYANLETAQPVKVFVSGAVQRPGLYSGYSSDSVLFYLDRAAGIDPDRGSFIDISIIRDGKATHTVNLYDFLVEGRLDRSQFHDGDTIFVNPLKQTATVTGEVRNAFRFEFEGPTILLSRILKLARPNSEATHVSIGRTRDGTTDSAYYSLGQAESVYLESGDAIDVVADLLPNTILVFVQGEHNGPKRQVLTYGSRLEKAIRDLVPSQRSDMESIQLFRRSVAKRQRELILQSLDNLERNILNARSASQEEAQLRIAESELLLKFIERAKRVQPKGQVILNDTYTDGSVFLEDGDVIFVPAVSSLVSVHGEVLFPNTQIHRGGETLEDYIQRAGGFTQNANRSNVLILRRDGSIENVKYTQGSYKKATLEPGDEIMVMPKANIKNIQLAKDLTQIMFQIAIAARALIDLD